MSSTEMAARPSSPPTQTYHPSFIPGSITPDIVHSAAGGAHYSGVPVEDGERVHFSTPDYHPSPNQSSHEIAPSRQKTLDDLAELYCCRPTIEILKRSWNEDAVFEDTLVKAKGYAQYAAQWFAMPSLFSNSRTISRRIISSTQSPHRLVFAQTQDYTWRLIGVTKRIESIVVVDLDEEDRIMKIVDQWQGQEPPTRFGAYFLRRVNAVVMPWIVKVPKDQR